MIFRTTHERLGFATCALVLLGAFSQNSYALSCKQNGSVRQDIVLDHEIKISTANTTAGHCYGVHRHTLQRSSALTIAITLGGENAYLYWDPKKNLAAIHNSIEVGVTYGSIDYRLTSGARENVGPGTSCRRGANTGRCLSPARSLSITVSYSVYIKATGNSPPAGGRINNNGSYSVFQVDGVGGLNSNASQNFNAYITGLGNIRFISCNPIVTVQANNGRVVDFGKIPRQNAVVGKVEKQIPFAVSADMSGPDSGQDCKGQVLQASFSSVNPVRDTNTIMPTSDSGFGIQLSPQDAPSSYIPMNTPLDLGLVNGSNVTKNFLASFRWLSTSPRVGPFRASANIDVTFK